jgi:hypothetical protein
MPLQSGERLKRQPQDAALPKTLESEVALEHFQAFAHQVALLGHLSIRCELIDNFGKQGSYTRACLLVRYAGLSSYLLQLLVAERLVDLLRRHLLILPGADPGLNGISHALLLERLEQSLYAAVVLNHLQNRGDQGSFASAEVSEFFAREITEKTHNEPPFVFDIRMRNQELRVEGYCAISPG